MNAKAEQKGRTHTAILDSAARLVRRRGVAGAGVAEVMRGAGLTVGGFYAHFASKDALVDEVLARTLEQMRARLFRDLDDKPAGARAAIVLKRYLSTVHRDADAEGCPLPAVIGEIATTAPAHRRALAEQTRAFVDALAALLPGARARARATALGLVALMVGGLSLARALRGTPLSDEVIGAARALGLRVLDDDDQEKAR